MLISFEKTLNSALVLCEDLEARIKQLVGQINKLERVKPGKPPSMGLRRFKHENNLEDPEDVARNLAQWDPSGTETVPKGLYVGWILKMVAGGQIRLPEDGTRIQNSLTIFDKIKKTKRFKGDKDIHKYKNFRELESITNKFQAQLTQEDEPTNLRSWFKWVERQGVTLFMKDEKFTVLLFDSSDSQENIGAGYNVEKKITKGIVVTPKKLMVGEHGQTIETSWVPLWAIENEEDIATDHNGKKIAPTVTPTAMALSRLACGSSYCVASPVTGQTYLDDGPLYATFKKTSIEDKNGELYLLANASWSEFMNSEDLGFALMAASTSFFMAKLVVEKHQELGEKAVRNITRHIKTALDAGKIRSGRPEGTQSFSGSSGTNRAFDPKRLAPVVKDTIMKALQIGQKSNL